MPHSFLFPTETTLSGIFRLLDLALIEYTKKTNYFDKQKRCLQ